MSDYKEQEQELILLQSYSSRVVMAKAYGEVITQLKADLAKFGGHTAECSSHRSRWKKAKWLGVECDCGWAKVEKP